MSRARAPLRMTLANGRGAALLEALRHTLGRPLDFALMAGATAVVLAALLLGALAAWRLLPLEVPPWMRAQALVLAGGAEGETDLAATRAALRQVAAVASAEFIGRDAALAELAQRPGLANLGLRELRPNPLPDAFVVVFAPGAAPEVVEAAVVELGKARGVESVHYQADAYRRAVALARLAGRLLALLGAALGGAALLGLALAATLRVRLDPAEIRLLQVLGADPAALRRPYVYAGALTLLAAAGLALWITRAAGEPLDALMGELARQYGFHWSAQVLPPWAGAAFCLAFALLGALLASAAARVAVRAARADPAARG